MIKFIKSSFNKVAVKYLKYLLNKNKRLRLSDVRAGQEIVIEWDKIKGDLGTLKCINNDPKTKKILLEITWRATDKKDESKELTIFSYSDKVFMNFHLLNEKTISMEVDDDYNDDCNDLASLQTKLNDALDEENYDQARIFQTKIDKILKK